MLIDTMKIKEELAKYFPEPKPKNSPEITTVLASIAEILAQDEDFHNFSIPRLVFNWTNEGLTSTRSILNFFAKS